MNKVPVNNFVMKVEGQTVAEFGLANLPDVSERNGELNGLFE